MSLFDAAKLAAGLFLLAVGAVLIYSVANHILDAYGALP